MTTTTHPAPIFTELSAIHGFLRATAGDVPAPGIISMSGISADRPTVHLHFDSLDDLREWAAYLQVAVEAHFAESTQRVHHNATATWGPTHGKFVTFDMVYLEPKRLPVETFTCAHCGASFGIAGGVEGEEYGADDYFASEVQRHESGECVAIAMPRDCESVEF